MKNFSMKTLIISGSKMYGAVLFEAATQVY